MDLGLGFMMDAAQFTIGGFDFFENLLPGLGRKLIHGRRREDGLLFLVDALHQVVGLSDVRHGSILEDFQNFAALAFVHLSLLGELGL